MLPIAKFWPAYIETLRREGGFKLSNKSTDLGRMTFAGISRRWHPDWEGWVLVDAGDRKSRELRTMVANFYIREFWRPIKGSQIESQDIAKDIFDFAVNSNWDDAAKAAQAICGAGIDGKIGNKTLEKLNAMTYLEFGGWYAMARLGHFQSIIDEKPSQVANQPGWVNRLLDVTGIRHNG